jgi:ABC-type bacteriocin/lantibiotic exporter with double-glycine peptidase domain
MIVLPASKHRALTCLALLLALVVVGGCSSDLSPSAENGLASPALAGTIAVPWIKQKNKTECGRAVLASLAARLCGDTEAYYARLPAPPDQARGYSVPEMKRFGASVGVELTVQAPAGIVIAGECSPRPPVTAHFSRLAELVAAGKPIVVPVTSGVSAGHYLVLVGAQSDGFIVLDPGSPGLRLMATADLASLMCDFGYVALVSR